MVKSQTSYPVENFLFYRNDGGAGEESILRKMSSQFIPTLDIGDKSAAENTDQQTAGRRLTPGDLECQGWKQQPIGIRHLFLPSYNKFICKN